MSKGKRRVNPRRIPVGVNKIDKEKLDNEATRKNLYHAWLLVVHSILSQEVSTVEDKDLAWKVVDCVKVKEAITKEEIHMAESIVCGTMPHPNISQFKINHVGDKEVYLRRATENALHIALCSVALGLKDSGLYSDGKLKKIFMNVELTLSELDGGLTDWNQLAKEVLKEGQKEGRYSKDLDFD